MNYTTGRILTISAEDRLEKSIIEEDGMGAGPLDSLVARDKKGFCGFRNPALSYQDDAWYGNNRTANTYKLKELIGKGYIHIEDTALLEELETLRYTFDHNQRRILISKDKMKKDGFKSPNMADALIMVVSLIGEVTSEQDNMYLPKHKTVQENLFGIAGVR